MKKFYATFMLFIFCVFLLPIKVSAACNSIAYTQASDTSYEVEVSVGGSESMTLYFSSNYSLVLESEDDTIATASVTGTSTIISSSGISYGKTITINGHKTGATIINVNYGSKTVAAINVSVVPQTSEFSCYLTETYSITVVSNSSQSYYTDNENVNIDSISTTTRTTTYSVTIGGVTTSYTITTYTSVLTLSFDVAGELEFGIYGTESGQMVSAKALIQEMVSIEDCDISLSADSFVYDGNEKTPSVTVNVNGMTLTKDMDYTVSYSNNINAGTATVTVTGMGNYTGTVTKTFTINKASQTVTITGESSVTVGSTVQLSTTASGGGVITYTSNETSVATVNSSGVVTGIAAGTATITATVAATDNYNAGSATITITVTNKLESVTISSVENVTSGITIKWSKITGADGYYVYRKVSGGSYSLVKTVTSGSTVSYTDSGVKDNSGKTYIYYVIPYYKDSNGTVTKGSYTNTKTILRLKSSTISSVANATSGITIKWSKITGANGYYVYRKVSGGSYSLVKTVTSGSTVSYTDTAVKNNSGKTYTYYVIPYYKDSNGTVTKGSYSNTKTVIRLKSVTISSLSNNASGITIKWGKITGAKGYYVYRKVSGGSYSLVKTISSGSTVSYTDTAVKSKNGTTYVYYVIPYYKNSSGTVTKGSYVNTKTMVRLTAVSISSLTNSSSKKMTVKWAKNSKATGYEIQYSTSSSFASGNKTITVSSASTVSKIISSLTKGKTYYVRIRAYKTVSGTKYYSAWSGKKSVKISK